MSIGKNIKAFRKQKKLTQEELALKSKISRSYLADVERDRYNPSLDTLKAIANALDVDASVLLGEKREDENIEHKVKKTLGKDILDTDLNKLMDAWEELYPRIEALPKHKKEELYKAIIALARGYSD